MNSITRPLYPLPAWANNSAVPGQLLTVTSTAVVQLTTPLNRITDLVMFDVQLASVWATVDGSTPSTNAGHVLAAGTAYTWSAGMMNAAKFVATGTTNAEIWVSELQV